MSDKQTIAFAALILLIVATVLGFKAWAKNELCSTYYKEMNRIACFLNDSTLPQRTNR